MANEKNKIDNVETAYQTELKKIALISQQFNAFMNDAVKNYPTDKTRKLHLISTLITEIVEKNDTPTYSAKQKVEEIYRLVDEFAPKTAVKEVEEENSFNLDDVLNPKKDLDLMALCKELGVTE
ncbi:MAG: hypothetical protein J6R88_04630 [Clostridia bacterium]|nr:hypothetical protein [Clostridia bacterium]